MPWNITLKLIEKFRLLLGRSALGYVRWTIFERQFFKKFDSEAQKNSSSWFRYYWTRARMNMRILDPKQWLLYPVKVAEIFKNGLFFALFMAPSTGRPPPPPYGRPKEQSWPSAGSNGNVRNLSVNKWSPVRGERVERRVNVGYLVCWEGEIWFYECFG